MIIRKIKVMRGPNMWSNYRKKLIVMHLDIGDLEDFPTNKIEGFSARIKNLIPSLFSHRCSEENEGGFFFRVDNGTWIGHVIEHIALEIQSLAGMNPGYGRTRSTNERGVYHVIFAYGYEKAGIFAAAASVRIAEALISGQPYEIENDIDELKRIARRSAFGPSTSAIVNEAIKRNIPVKRLNNASLITFGQGIYQKKIRATMTGLTSGLGIDAAADKEETKTLLSRAHIPVAAGQLIDDLAELNAAIKRTGFPLVIKPVNGNHGRGVTTNINSLEQAIEAFNLAKTISGGIIVEKFIKGGDYRFLVINYKLVAAAKRTPAMVTGDGESTIQQLIDITNSDPERGNGHNNNLTLIAVDEVTMTMLREKHLTLDSILPTGEIVYLKSTANLSTGGMSRDVTDLVHPHNKLIAERIARIINLDICGIDIVTSDIESPITAETGAIIEVNACPGFRMHLNPSKGRPRNVAEPVIDMLFPEGSRSRVPLIAVTGTNGKTTTTRLIAHLAKTAGHKVGFTSTDGIYIQGHQICEGDCSGPGSAETVLTDPTIDFAVLECARGGILRSGLGFDKCDISIVTNVTEDHLGLGGINTLREMADVKSVVPKSTANEGFAILNADDDLVYRMKRGLDCQIALFSINPGNKRLIHHCENGGLGATIEDGYLCIINGQWKTMIAEIDAIPLTQSGRAECMIKNTMPAVLAAIIQGFSHESIREGLSTFMPSPEFTPGRFNIFNFRKFDVMVDYAHNPDGYLELGKFLNKTKATSKTGIIAVPGDRRDEDIINVGRHAAKMFDSVIIRHDKDLRGRAFEDMNKFLIEGLRSENPSIKIEIIPDEREALLHAINSASDGAFITDCTDAIGNTIDLLKDLQEKENKNASKAAAFELLRAS